MSQQQQPELKWESLAWPDGSSYEGLTTAGGQITGQGTFQHANGDRYEGEWNAGVPEGYGSYVWNSGTMYRGEWRAGLIHGCGVRLKRGEREGEFDVQEGKFLGDKYVGPVMACSVEASRAAALEADVAARLASIAFSTPQGRQHRQQHARSVRASQHGAGNGEGVQAGGVYRGKVVSTSSGEGGKKEGFKWPFSWPWAKKDEQASQQSQPQPQNQWQQQRGQQQQQQPSNEPWEQGWLDVASQMTPVLAQSSSTLPPPLPLNRSQQQQTAQGGDTVSVGLRPSGERHLSRNQRQEMQQQHSQSGDGHRTRGLTQQEQQMMGGIVDAMMRAEAEAQRGGSSTRK